MKGFLKILFIIVIIFIINVIVFTVYPDYKFFLQKIKTPDKVVYVEEKVINDDDVNLEKIVEKKVLENEIIKEKDIKEEIPDKTENNLKNITILKNKNISKEIKLGKEYQKVLKAFSGYTLGKIEINPSLFDLTNEYPEQYIEYYSNELTIYFFINKSYEDVKEVIEVVSYKQPYKVNELNNLGEKSFYINLDENIRDNYVRVVIKIKSIVLGLKIKKDQYNKVKEILKTLK